LPGAVYARHDCSQEARPSPPRLLLLPSPLLPSFDRTCTRYSHDCRVCFYLRRRLLFSFPTRAALPSHVCNPGRVALHASPPHAGKPSLSFISLVVYHVPDATQQPLYSLPLPQASNTPRLTPACCTRSRRLNAVHQLVLGKRREASATVPAAPSADRGEHCSHVSFRCEVDLHLAAPLSSVWTGAPAVRQKKSSSAPPATSTTWRRQQLAPACPAESGALPRIVPASRSTCLGKLEICSAPLHQTAITALGKNHQDPVPPRPRPSLPTHVTPHRRPPTNTPLPFFGPRISLLTISPPCPIHTISQHPRECHFVCEASLFGTSLARIPRSTPPSRFRYH
jgi:hypothetical protein